jgi:hypothetical protein
MEDIDSIAKNLTRDAGVIAFGSEWSSAAASKKAREKAE